MSNCTDMKVGDVVRLMESITADVTEGGITLNLTIGVGDLFTVNEVLQDDAVVQHSFKIDSTIIDIGIQVSKDKLQCFIPAEPPVEPPVDPEPPVEPPEEVMCDKNRYSAATIRDTTKRPEVFLYQGAGKAVGVYQGDIDGWYGTGSKKAFEDFQTANNLSPVDGIIGGDTATELIKQATATGFKADLHTRIMSLIAYYEVGNRADAFGMAENDIGDGAGANYGVFQCNNYGSVVSMLNLAGRSDLVSVYNNADKTKVNPTIKDWFGGTEGIATQMRYLEEKLMPIAMRELREFGSFDAWETDSAMAVWWGRAVLIFLDSTVQNGTMWSTSRRPFWKDLNGAEGRPSSQNIPELYYGTWWDEQLGEYIKYEDMKTKWWAEKEVQDTANPDHSKVAYKTANRNVAKDIVDNIIPSSSPQSKLLILAQFRSRSSSPTWWYQAVASRRVTDATGDSKDHPSGVVNGAHLVLPCDYQL